MTVDFHGHAVLAPLTKGGNLPFRRLCVELGARITTSEMAYARQVVRRSRSELALLRRHSDETCFGVQLATTNADEGVRAGQMAIERGAVFVDLNCGCPIHDVVRRGMGATLLKRPAALARIVEGMVEGLDVPVTVKIRTGWKVGEENALEIGRLVAEAGAAALIVHGRSREQRYTKAADWDLIGELVAALDIPVIGNGDILTHYEARERQRASGCAAVMLGRGALIKPWVFREIAEGVTWQPTAEERVALYRRLAWFMREHFRDDERGRVRAMNFLPWHLDFFARYRPLPEAEWGERAAEHPLLQTRMPDESDVPLLEALLRDPRAEMHERMAGVLWESETDEVAVSRLLAIAEETPPVHGQGDEIATSTG